MKAQLVNGQLVVPISDLVQALRETSQKLREDNHPIIANKFDELTTELIVQAVS